MSWHLRNRQYFVPVPSLRDLHAHEEGRVAGGVGKGYPGPALPAYVAHNTCDLHFGFGHALERREVRPLGLVKHERPVVLRCAQAVFGGRLPVNVVGKEFTRLVPELTPDELRGIYPRCAEASSRVPRRRAQCLDRDFLRELHAPVQIVEPDGCLRTVTHFQRGIGDIARRGTLPCIVIATELNARLPIRRRKRPGVRGHSSGCASGSEAPLPSRALRATGQRGNPAVCGLRIARSCLHRSGLGGIVMATVNSILVDLGHFRPHKKITVRKALTPAIAFFQQKAADRNSGGLRYRLASIGVPVTPSSPDGDLLLPGFLLAGDTLERRVKFAIGTEILQLNRIAGDRPLVFDRMAVDARFERNLVPVHFSLAD
jgi:hypothetical protein